MELKGQVAIITGAGRGIGRATALELTRMGADIVVAELDRAGAERTAAEVKGLGGRASVVPTDGTSRPGFVETDMWTVVAREQGALLGLPPEEFTRQRRAQVPLGRLERPEDVANVIAFLAGSRAAYMTGQAISVDGGLVMH